MLGVAALLASSSMAAIELITLYARLDNAVHKMAPPLHHHAPQHPLHLSSPLPPPHRSSRLLATEKT